MTPRRVHYTLPETSIAKISAAGERLGVPDSAVVTLLADHAPRLTERDAAKLPKGRGRKGGGRRDRKKPTEGE